MSDERDILRELYESMGSDKRFENFRRDLELHVAPSDDSALSIDFHNVADFKLINDEKHLSILVPVNFEPTVAFLKFLHENGIKRFNEVTLFGNDGCDHIRIGSPDRNTKSMYTHEVLWFVSAVAGLEGDERIGG